MKERRKQLANERERLFVQVVGCLLGSLVSRLNQSSGSLPA